MNSKYLEIPIEELKLNSIITDKLRQNNIVLVKDVWLLKRKDLKDFKLNDNEINQIIIKLQLNGIDLNKRIY